MRWSRNLAYAVGLITTDGSLSKDGRHIELTSKDLEQIHNFIKALNLKNNKIGTKSSSYNPDAIYYRIQFSNTDMYRFLVKIGLTPNKTKTIGDLKIPDKYFADFLRGHLDGDGYTTAFWDSVFKDSFRLYAGFVSASEAHLKWIKQKIERNYNLKGSLHRGRGSHTFQLKYAKIASIKLINIIYYRNNLLYLQRKRSKIMKALAIISKQAGVEKLANSLP